MKFQYCSGAKSSYPKIYLVLFIVILFASNKIYAGTFQWAKDIKSPGFDEAFDLVVDPDGNTYVAGQIEFDTDFGNNVILHSAGIHDIFLAKYNAAGNLIWAKRAGGKGGDKIQSITLDGSGHIYVAGEFDDTCYWESIMKVTGGGPGVNNMFIGKYDTSGSVIWIRNIGGSGVVQTRGYGVTCDSQGNVYACGGTKGDTYYNGTFLFTTAGDYDGTVVKFDPNGNFRWARRIGGTDSDKAYGIAADNNGSVYVTGYFVGTADFSQNVSLTGRGHTDIFLAKYDTSGTLLWAKQAGDTGFDRGHDVTVNANNQIVITGEFQTGYFGSNLIHSLGNEDMFLASYNSSGNNIWALSGGSVEDDIGRGVSHDSAGNILVIGDYANTGLFPPASITSNGFADVFLASYTSDGSSLNWVRTMGGIENDRGRGVGADLAGDISICGEFVDSIRFDASNLTGETLLDIYVSRLIQGSLCSALVTVSAQNSCYGLCDGIAIAATTGQSPISYNWSTIPPQTGDIAAGLCQGTYSVIITDAFGCTASAAITLTDPLPLQLSGTITNASCTGCSDGSIDLLVNGGTINYTYAWSNGNSTEDPQNLLAGIYNVCVTDLNGCNLCDTFTVLDPSTGVNEFVNGKQYSVFPNPFSIFTTININIPTKETTAVVVYAATGDIVYQSEFTGNEFHLPADNLASGIYFLRLNNKIFDGMKMIPLVIE